MKTDCYFAAACILAGVILASSCSSGTRKDIPGLVSYSFPTNGSPVYQLCPGTVNKGGKRVIISGAYDGTVQCHRPDGKLLWKAQTGGSFPNDLEVSDLNGDGRDETLVASADGSLYVFDHNGVLKWKFPGELPLMTVCAVTSENKKLILTGGTEKKIYLLSSDGQLINTYNAGYVVRYIRKGNITGNGKDHAAVMYAKSVRGKDQYFLQLFDPGSLIPVWEKNVNIAAESLNECYFDLITADIDRDGDDDIIMSHGWRDNGKLSAYNHLGEKINLPRYQARDLTKTTYRMNLITHVKCTSTGDEYLLGLFGNQLIQYNLDLTLRDILTTSYSYANGTFDPVSGKYYLGSSISGGDCIHVIDIADPGWKKAYEYLAPSGNLEKIIKNIETLNRQIDSFTPPAYQPEPKKVLVVGETPGGSFADSITHIKFVRDTKFNENFDRSTLPGVWKTKKETRFEYRDTQEEIWQFAKNMEKTGQDFTVWGGHGNDPFYMQMETLEGFFKYAPNTFRGFVFPEMERTDEAMVQAVHERVIPLAELCLKHNKKIFLRNKNVYWLGSCYMDLWKSILLNSRYKSVFVPSMEETNDRMQDLTLSGRVGLWASGCFDQYSSRAVTDNACYTRLWEWCSQQVLMHLIRSMVLGSSLGSDILLINSYQGDPDQFMTLYKLLEKGIICIPDKEDLLSLSEVCLGIRDPSHGYLEHGKNHWGISNYEPDEKTYVFDRLDIFWSGAPVQTYDFSYYGTGSKIRMLDFLPKNPYGLVAFVPDDINLADNPRFKTKITTDGEFFYDENGVKHTAEEYRPVVEKHLKEAAGRLPVVVEGNVAWTVVRLDDNHIRLVLIDAGYLDPADRLATIRFQKITPAECRDILSNEIIPVSGNSAVVKVPAGIFRIIDITH